MELKIAESGVQFPPELNQMIDDLFTEASKTFKLDLVKGEVALTFNFDIEDGVPVAASLGRDVNNPNNFRINILPLLLVPISNFAQLLCLELAHLDQILSKRLVREDNGDMIWEGKLYPAAEVKIDRSSPWEKAAVEISDYLMLSAAKKRAAKMGVPIPSFMN